MSVPKRNDADARNSAAQMADAMDYLCRIAAEEGLDCVLCDLRVVRDKLQRIAVEGLDQLAGKYN